MPQRTGFLSHKVMDAKLARELQRELTRVFPTVKIFLSEDIAKARDFRKEITSALARASFFILLYTDPREDWSWCFYEVGSYRSLKPKIPEKKRPVYCLHSEAFAPPSPLANLQTVKADAPDIEQWIRELSQLLNHKTPAAERISSAVKKIERAVKARSVLLEQVIKPYVSIIPPWPDA